jgi:hypothetical protein
MSQRARRNIGLAFLSVSLGVTLFLFFGAIGPVVGP